MVVVDEQFSNEFDWRKAHAHASLQTDAVMFCVQGKYIYEFEHALPSCLKFIIGRT